MKTEERERASNQTDININNKNLKTSIHTHHSQKNRGTQGHTSFDHSINELPLTQVRYRLSTACRVSFRGDH